MATPCGEGTLVWHGWGPAGGRPVVLLHGGSGSWTHWLSNIAALADAGHAVPVPDLPGFGDSAPPPDGHWVSFEAAEAFNVALAAVLQGGAEHPPRAPAAPQSP